jgi:hypothetical protein
MEYEIPSPEEVNDEYIITQEQQDPVTFNSKLYEHTAAKQVRREEIKIP